MCTIDDQGETCVEISLILVMIEYDHQDNDHGIFDHWQKSAS